MQILKCYKSKDFRSAPMTPTFGRGQHLGGCCGKSLRINRISSKVQIVRQLAVICIVRNSLRVHSLASESGLTIPVATEGMSDLD